MNFSDKVSYGIVVPVRMLFLMWAVFLIDGILAVNFALFGILPRDLWGMVGIFTAPLIHGNLLHLASNSLPVLFLGTTLYVFYDRIANRVFAQCYILTGLLVWIFARPTLHIGASGLIYGLASFLMFFGIFRQDIKSILISLIIIFLYGGYFMVCCPPNRGYPGNLI